MKVNWKALAVCLLLPLAVGFGAALLTMDGMKAFEAVPKPPFSPPGWLFPVVWTVLYLLMGIASDLVLTAPAGRPSPTAALSVYGVQLLFNFFWSIFFFGLSLYLFSFVWLLLLFLLILVNLYLFARVSRPAGLLLLPYLLWVAFAAYLNFGVYALTR